jgi:hypothetical protein
MTARVSAIGVDLTMAEGAGGDCGKRTTIKRTVCWGCALPSRGLGQLGAGSVGGSWFGSRCDISICADTRHRGMQRSQLCSPRPRTRRLRPRPIRGASRRGSGRRGLLLHSPAAMGNPGAGVRVGTASHRRRGPDRHIQKLAGVRRCHRSRPSAPAVSNTRDTRREPGPPL